MFFRDTWAEVNIDNLKENIHTLKARVKKSFFAVVKANGYGCGDFQVAKAALCAGAEYLAVSSLDEALSLRNKGINANILVLEYINPVFLHIARNNNITVTASSLDWTMAAIQNDITGLKIHLKYDTGMNRIGFTNIQELKLGLNLLLENSAIIEGIYTHFACADNEDNLMCNTQLDKFKIALDNLNYNFKWIHVANSDATIHFQENISNAVRCGIAMLGISSYDLELKPVLSLYSRIVNVKMVEANETIGYGATYIAKENQWVGTIPIGYADGWLRTNQGRNCILNNNECEFIGRVCMDQSMIKLPTKVSLGTVVELIGPNMPLDRVASEMGTIPYEIITLLSDRIAKIYICDQCEIAVTNARLDSLVRND